MAADCGGAQPSAPCDRGVVQPLGHEFQDRLLRRGAPAPWYRGSFGAKRCRAVPQQLEVLPQGGDDHRRPDH